MDRMTKWNGKKYILPQGKGEFRRIADRLAAYEDTGYEPEEIKRFLRGEEKAAKSKRVFISGPITGTDDYEERFEKAEKALKANGYYPINPTKCSEHLLEAEFSWDEFIEVTMSLLKQCSGIYMLKDWENSRGAAKEFQYATTHNYFIIKEAY